MMNNSTLIEMLAWYATDGIRHPDRATQAAMLREPVSRARGSLRRSLASYLVRLGLRLDPAAGGDSGRPLTNGAHAGRGA